MWSESKANASFDNNTGIELDAQRCSKQELKNMECVFLLWIFQCIGHQRGDHCRHEAACECFFGFLTTPIIHECKNDHDR